LIAARLIGGKSKFVPKSVLEVTRARDANAAAYSKSVVQAVQFHPTAPAILTAGLDKTVRLFQVHTLAACLPSPPSSASSSLPLPVRPWQDMCGHRAAFDILGILWQVDGKNNTLMQSTFIRDLPMSCAAFTRGGNEVVMSGRRRFFYVFDLQTGQVRKVPCIHGAWRPLRFEFGLLLGSL